MKPKKLDVVGAVVGAAGGVAGEGARLKTLGGALGVAAADTGGLAPKKLGMPPVEAAAEVAVALGGPVFNAKEGVGVAEVKPGNLLKGIADVGVTAGGAAGVPCDACDRTENADLVSAAGAGDENIDLDVAVDVPDPSAVNGGLAASGELRGGVPNIEVLAGCAMPKSFGFESGMDGAGWFG